MSGTLNPYRHQYEVVPASTTNQILGNTGAVGDFLHRLIVYVSATATSNFNITDGSTLVTSSGNVLATGVYSYEFNMASQNGAWKITTNAGVSVIGVGTFTN